MERIKIDLQGIKRDVSPLAAPLGTCQEVVNLRLKDGALRPVLPEKILMYGQSDNVRVRNIVKLYAHNALPHNSYLAYTRVQVGDYLYGRLLHIRIDTGEDIELLQTIRQWEEAGVGGFTYDLDFGFQILGESKQLLSITTYNDTVVVSVRGKTTVHLYKNNRYRINEAVTDLKDLQVASANHDQQTLETGLQDTYTEARTEMLRLISEQREEKRYNGYLVLVAAYRMSDGAIVKTSHPVMSVIGRSDGEIDSREIETAGDKYNIKGVNVSKVKVKVNTMVSQWWTEVIKNVEIYACYQPAYNMPDEEEITKREFVFKDHVFYLIESVPYTHGDTDSVAGAQSLISHEFELDLENIEAKETLVVDDSHHDICFRHGFPYNGYLHASNMLTYLSTGYAPTVQLEAFMANEQPGYIQRLLGDTITGTPASVFSALWGCEQPVVIMHIKTDDGQRTVTREYPTDAKLFQTSSGAKLVLPKIITYPHLGATHFEVVVPVDDSNGELLYKGKMTPHSFYNMSYHVVDDNDRVYGGDNVTGVVYSHISLLNIVFNHGEGSFGEQSIDFPVAFTYDGTVETFDPLTINPDEASWDINNALASYRAWFNGTPRPFGLKLAQATGSHNDNTSEVMLRFTSAVSVIYHGDLTWSYEGLSYEATAQYMTTLDPGTPSGVNVVAIPGTHRVPVVDSSAIRLSSLNNPFVYPPKDYYQVGDDKTNDIRSLAVQSSPVSEGQFGQFPLVVFTGHGVYFMDQGLQTVYQSTRQVSNLSGLSAMGVSSAVIFNTEKGLYLLSGREVTELTRNILPNTLIPTEDTETPEIALDTSDYLSNIEFGYDTINRELMIINPQKDFHYRYQDNGFMFAMTSSHTGLMIKHGLWQAYKISGAHHQQVTVKEVGKEQSQTSVDVFIKTNPVSFGLMQHKKLFRTMYYIDAVTPETAGFFNIFVFGGNRPDMDEFPVMQKSLVDEDETVMFVRMGRVNYSVRYFIFMLSGKINPEAVLHHIETEVMPVMGGRLR